MGYNFPVMKKSTPKIIPAILALAFALSACGSPAQSQPQVQPTAAEPAPAVTDQEPEPGVEPETALPTCALPLPGPEDWPVFICDTFEGARSTFPTENQDNAYARYDAKVSDGQFYQVDYAAKGFAQYQRSTLTWFDIATAQDFALSISGTMDSKFKDVSWGLAFRGSEDRESYFLFSIMNDGTYAFEIYENKGWISLISKRPYNGIKLGEENTLTVIAEGKSFKFLINGQPVNEFDGGLLEGMQVFLLVSAKEGSSVVFSFDDLVMQI
jgi:hypothetical protein